MKLRPKYILRLLARHIGLKVKFVHYFADNVYGKLLPREKRILINANKPRCEHVFTLLHEFAHFWLHFQKRMPRRHCPWYLRLNWKIEAIAKIASKMRRAIRFMYNSKKGQEWEADVWAMCALVYLVKFMGDTDLKAFLHRHPEKKTIYRLAAIALIYSGAKKRFATAVNLLRRARDVYRASVVINLRQVA